MKADTGLENSFWAAGNILHPDLGAGFMSTFMLYKSRFFSTQDVYTSLNVYFQLKENNIEFDELAQVKDGEN